VCAVQPATIPPSGTLASPSIGGFAPHNHVIPSLHQKWRPCRATRGLAGNPEDGRLAFPHRPATEPFPLDTVAEFGEYRTGIGQVVFCQDLLGRFE
jgi:hypothetical protein